MVNIKIPLPYAILQKFSLDPFHRESNSLFVIHVFPFSGSDSQYSNLCQQDQIIVFLEAHSRFSPKIQATIWF